MLYLGIDQHARQLTISLRDESGDVVQARQVSTEPKRIRAFFEQLTHERLGGGEAFVAVVEVCGFNDWLIQMLHEYGCRKAILIQPEDRKQRKTDRRDAAALSELLWVNRARLLEGKPVRGLRQVDIASHVDQENRRLTTLRKEVSRARTRVVNKIRHILRRHNRQWEMPTKKFPSKSAIAWLKQVVLPEIDRLEMNHLLAELDQVEQRRKELGQVIIERCGVSEEAQLIASMPGVSYFTATSLACRVGRVERFPRAHSLPNYWGADSRLPQQRREQPAVGEHYQGGQQHRPVAAGTNDDQSAAEGWATTGMVQAHQASPGVNHRPGGRDEKTGHNHLAHVKEANDLGGVPSSRRHVKVGWRQRDLARPRRQRFIALVPIPNGGGRHRAAPFGAGRWDGARVASQQSSTLRPGQWH